MSNVKSHYILLVAIAADFKPTGNDVSHNIKWYYVQFCFVLVMYTGSLAKKNLDRSETDFPIKVPQLPK